MKKTTLIIAVALIIIGIYCLCSFSTFIHPVKKKYNAFFNIENKLPFTAKK